MHLLPAAVLLWQQEQLARLSKLRLLPTYCSCPLPPSLLSADLGTLLPALQARLIAGVQAEQEQEQAAIRRLYAASTLRSLQRDGIVLLRLQAAPSHVLYSSMVWKFSLVGRGGAPGRDLPYHRFRQGDSLLVSRFSEDQVRCAVARCRVKGGPQGRGSCRACSCVWCLVHAFGALWSEALLAPLQMRAAFVHSAVLFPVWDCLCSVATQACVLICAPCCGPRLLLSAGVPLPLHSRSAPCLLCLPLQLVEVGAHNSRSHSINRASAEGSNDLRPGSDGFRPLDATVVEVGACRPVVASGHCTLSCRRHG